MKPFTATFERTIKKSSEDYKTIMMIEFDLLPIEIQTIIVNKFLQKTLELAEPFFEKLGESLSEKSDDSAIIEARVIVQNGIGTLPDIVSELWAGQTIEISEEELESLKKDRSDA